MYKKHVKDELFYKPSYELSNKQTNKIETKKKKQEKGVERKEKKKRNENEKNEYIIEKRYRNK